MTEMTDNEKIISENIKEYGLIPELPNIHKGGSYIDDKKETRGGSRKGAGRPRKMKNPGTINFWIESDDIARLKEKYGNNLNKMFGGWVRFMLEEEE